MPGDDTTLNTLRSNRFSSAAIAHKAVYVLLAFAVIRFWLMPLGSGFWTDETGTYWSVKDSLPALWANTRDWPSVTPLYGLICRLAIILGGAHEYALRIPSVLAIAAASWFMFRLVTRLIDRGSAVPSVAAFICYPAVIFAAVDARAYAIVLALAIGSILALVTWLKTDRTVFAFWYVVSAALIPEFHYLATPVLLVHAIYAMVRFREGTPVRLWKLVVAGTSVGILLLPTVPLILRIHGRRDSYAWLERPLVPELANMLIPSVAIFGAAMGLLLAWMVCKKIQVQFNPVPASTTWLLLTLALGPALLFFVFSNISSTKIFVDRYVIVSFAGLAMITGWAVGGIQTALARSVVTGSIIICSLAGYGNAGRLWPRHGHDDWRGAIIASTQVEGSAGIPLLAQSGFIESAKLKLDLAADYPGFLMAPFSIYRPAGPLIPLSIAFDDRSRAYLEETVVPAVEKAPRFMLMAYGTESPYGFWLAGRLPAYSAKRLGVFGSNSPLVLTLFERRSDSGHDASIEVSAKH